MIQYRNIMDVAIDHTPVLWIFPNMPLIMYPADYIMTYPESVLNYNRSVSAIAVDDFYDASGICDLKRIVDTYELKTVNSR